MVPARGRSDQSPFCFERLCGTACTTSARHRHDDAPVALCYGNSPVGGKAVNKARSMV
ncbi:hypothetical protein Y88_1825 [Novosphingobium nitrogenifigens DSM 19370]|uniref:Uncharacterized protein n=1 Tax=Novosphingobium nitrogenifigens DSM 19370 TaxID=983920 RepID=F1Z3T2_9SPHN|nr:hypothetical protein Y88_1825 [Novosphingobium nitrogenifigens DSM 19370]